MLCREQKKVRMKSKTKHADNCQRVRGPLPNGKRRKHPEDPCSMLDEPITDASARDPSGSPRDKSTK
jgi:hypothetical protein